MSRLMIQAWLMGMAGKDEAGRQWVTWMSSGTRHCELCDEVVDHGWCPGDDHSFKVCSRHFWVEGAAMEPVEFMEPLEAQP